MKHNHCSEQRWMRKVRNLFDVMCFWGYRAFNHGTDRTQEAQEAEEAEEVEEVGEAAQEFPDVVLLFNSEDLGRNPVSFHGNHPIGWNERFGIHPKQSQSIQNCSDRIHIIQETSQCIQLRPIRIQNHLAHAPSPNHLTQV